MNFNFPLLKSIRILLFPFSLVYALIVTIRNWLFDKGILRSSSFSLPIICVGNLAVGGTGKSPMVEWLIRLLKDRYPIAVLSRGYKRKTRGYALANASTTALDIGDEPMQFHSKFPDVAIAVGEERIVAIPQLLHDRPATRAIILDDAFQHRTVRAGLNVLLTDYSNLFTRDWWLPSGDLRDAPSSYRRAGIIVVTKCPAGLSEEERRAIVTEMRPRVHQQVFFSTIQYGQPYHITQGIGSGAAEENGGALVARPGRASKTAAESGGSGETPVESGGSGKTTAESGGSGKTTAESGGAGETSAESGGMLQEEIAGATRQATRPGRDILMERGRGRLPAEIVIDDTMEVLLVTGIANPAPLKQWLDQYSRTYYEIAYGDHHIFTIDDLHSITRRFETIQAEKKIILTTEKDAVRLIKFRQELEGLPFYVLPIAPGFLFGDEPRFTDLILTFIQQFPALEGAAENQFFAQRKGSAGETNKTNNEK